VVQDEITQRVVSTLIAHITKAEIERSVRKGVPDLGVYDYTLRGRELRLRYTRTDTEEAVQLLEQAVTLDPSFAPAHVELGHAYRIKSNQRWTNEPEKELKRASDLAQRAITLDPALAEAHALLGSVYVLQGRFDEALAANERAVALNPSDAESYSRLAVALTRAGHPKQAIDRIRDAIRLDPFYPPIYLAYLGRAHYLAREYDKAVPTLKQCVERVPELSTCRGWLAASYAQLGRNVSAREELAHWRRLRPGVTAQQYRHDQAQGYAKSADFDHVMDGLKKAGLSDSGD
jgi:adenylate cyclase